MREGGREGGREGELQQSSDETPNLGIPPPFNLKLFAEKQHRLLSDDL